MTNPNIHTFAFPTPTICGAGALNELPNRLAKLTVRRPLVVTDSGLAQTKAFEALAAVLGPGQRDKSWFVYSGVHPNPVENDVREAAEACRQNHCDGVIAIGGGSPLDVGKAARLLVKRSGFNLARFYDESDWSS